jgi:predicted transcriptional regulator
MQQKYFKKILTDLYTIYNPSNLEVVDDLVERYKNGLEFDAIKNIFIKYNRKNAEYYNPELNSDENIFGLIKNYNTGVFSLENINLKTNKRKNQQTEEKKKVYEELEKVNKTQSQTKEEIEKKINEIKNAFETQEKQLKESLEKTYKEIEEKLSKLQKPLTVENKKDVEIKIISNDLNQEINLPNKEHIAAMGTGARLIVPDGDGKPVAFEILDITFDSFSYKNEIPVIEIIVKKM